MPSILISIQRPGAAPQTLELPKPKTVMGREAGDVALGDAQASSTHCELSIEGGRVKLKDLGSTNGTYVNGQPVTEVLLSPGQAFSVGRTLVVIMAIKGSAASATP